MWDFTVHNKNVIEENTIFDNGGTNLHIHIFAQGCHEDNPIRFTQGPHGKPNPQKTLYFREFIVQIVLNWTTVCLRHSIYEQFFRICNVNNGTNVASDNLLYKRVLCNGLPNWSTYRERFLKRYRRAQRAWRAKRDRFICKRNRRLFHNHSPWLVLDCSAPLMAFFNRV